MRASERRMLRRRRRTFLCAAMLTVCGVITAQRSGAADPPPQQPAAEVEPAVVVSYDIAESDARSVRAATHARSCPRSAAVCVDLVTQRAWLQRQGRTTYGPVRIGQGPDGHPTPKGTFHVTWKAVEYTSKQYGIAMPYSVFFTASRIAFHQGKLDEPSHGCVHLTRKAARAFYAGLTSGDEVHVA